MITRSPRGDRVHCYYCRCRMDDPASTSPSHPYMRTKDHIYPLMYGALPQPIVNKRYCCLMCNQLRAVLNHCTGALMMVLDEHVRMGKSIDAAMVRLGYRDSHQKRMEKARIKAEIRLMKTLEKLNGR